MSSAPRCFWRLYVFTRHLYYAGLSEPGVPGVPWHPQIFPRSVNPGLFQQGGADFAHQITPPPPPRIFSDLPTALLCTKCKISPYAWAECCKISSHIFCENLSKSFITSQGLPWTISIYILACCIKLPSAGFFIKLWTLIFFFFIILLYEYVLRIVISEKKVQWY